MEFNDDHQHTFENPWDGDTGAGVEQPNSEPTRSSGALKAVVVVAVVAVAAGLGVLLTQLGDAARTDEQVAADTVAGLCADALVWDGEMEGRWRFGSCTPRDGVDVETAAAAVRDAGFTLEIDPVEVRLDDDLSLWNVEGVDGALTIAVGGGGTVGSPSDIVVGIGDSNLNPVPLSELVDESGGDSTDNDGEIDVIDGRGNIEITRGD